MKKIIAGVEYNTEKAELVGKYTEGAVGDSDGFEECLFKTENGKYFLYVNGGIDSKYPSENIKRISADKAGEWLEKQ